MLSTAHTPKYLQIAQQLRTEIVEQFSPGNYLPSERTLQRRFSVTQVTIRKALEVLTLERLVQTIPYKGTVVLDPSVNVKNASIVGGGSADSDEVLNGSRTISIVMPMEAYQVALIVPSVERELRRFGYRLLVCGTLPLAKIEKDTVAAEAYEQQVLDSLLEQSLAGIIWWSVFGERSVSQSFSEHPIPMVLLDNPVLGLTSDVVGIDDFRTGYVAADHLLQLGHRHLAYWSYEHSGRISSVGSDRFMGFLHALDRSFRLTLPNASVLLASLADVACDETSRILPPDVDKLLYFQDYDTIDDLLAATPRPTGVVVASDHLVYRFMSELNARGVRVPEDIAVVSVGDIDRVSERTQILTTMREPFEEMGRRAALLLLQRIMTPDRPTVHIELPAELVIRDTCGSRRRLTSIADQNSHSTQDAADLDGAQHHSFEVSPA